MSEEQKSSMTSVWDTLNAMKARRAAVESSAKQHTRDEAARKKAQQLFADALVRAADARVARDENDHLLVNTAAPGGDNQNDVKHLADTFYTDCARDNDVSGLIAAYRTRAKENPAAEAVALRKSVLDAQDATKTASYALRRAKRLANGLSGFVE